MTRAGCRKGVLWHEKYEKYPIKLLARFNRQNDCYLGAFNFHLTWLLLTGSSVDLGATLFLGSKPQRAESSMFQAKRP